MWLGLYVKIYIYFRLVRHRRRHRQRFVSGVVYDNKFKWNGIDNTCCVSGKYLLLVLGESSNKCLKRYVALCTDSGGFWQSERILVTCCHSHSPNNRSESVLNRKNNKRLCLVWSSLSLNARINMSDNNLQGWTTLPMILLDGQLVPRDAGFTAQRRLAADLAVQRVVQIVVVQRRSGFAVEAVDLVFGVAESGVASRVQLGSGHRG